MECLRQQSNVKMLCSKQHCAFKFHVINGQNIYDQIMSDKMSKHAQSDYKWWKISKHAWSDCLLFAFYSFLEEVQMKLAI